MRVLVLGASGFIGTRVVDYLVHVKKVQVRAVVRDYRKAIRIARHDIEIIKAPIDDMSSEAMAENCDAVISCIHPFGAPNEKSAAIDSCNKSIRLSQRTRTRRFVYLSSAAVYGMRSGAVNEESQPCPDNVYIQAKLCCEKIITKAHKSGTIRGVILRPAIVYGPFSRSWTIHPVEQMRKGELMIPLNAAGNCNAVHIDDVACAAGEAAVTGSADGMIINLTGPNKLTWKEFYGFYEKEVRPGSLMEIPLSEIKKKISEAESNKNSWNSFKRILADRAVRDRLNEIPLVSRLNTFCKSAGWKGLPPIPIEHSSISAMRAQFFPDSFMLNLYTRAPFVESLNFSKLLNFPPIDIATGMKSTISWLRWAGFSNDLENSVFEHNEN